MADNAPIPFAQAVPKIPQEPDRHAIKDDMNIIITGVYISTQTKYEKIAKINGLVDGKETKWYTTAEVIVKHVEELIQNVGVIDGKLKTPVSAHVFWKVSGAGHKYLEME